jgi:hypothetical protein
MTLLYVKIHSQNPGELWEPQNGHAREGELTSHSLSIPTASPGASWPSEILRDGPSTLLILHFLLTLRAELGAFFCPLCE